MSDIKVLRAHDPYANGAHAFSIVASDKKVEYIFREGSELFNGKSLLKAALGFSEDKPKTADQWLTVASSPLGSYKFTSFSVDQESDKPKKFDDYVSDERIALDSVVPVPKSSVRQAQIGDTMGRLLDRHPNIADYLADPKNYDLPEYERKLLIATLIAASGTLDLNPWLSAWLEGTMDVNDINFTGLVLSRPSAQSPNYNTVVDYDKESGGK